MESLSPTQLKANISLKGDTLLLRVKFTGYDKGKLANNVGVNVRTYVTLNNSELIIGADNIVVGWIYYFQVSMDSLPSNSIQIQGINHLLGNIVSSNPISLERESVLR
ncbi:DUF4879 domain-containing protein [Niallia circulans]|uniref:DUF4879 domain-containing protein n=1 Tax=Niallia circulans TaxID=1397 RepID=UPI00163B4A36